MLLISTNFEVKSIILTAFSQNCWKKALHVCFLCCLRLIPIAVSDLQALPSDYEDEPDLPDMEGRERPASGASDGGSSSSSSDSDNDSDTEDRPGQSGSQGDGELSTMADVIKDIVAKGMLQSLYNTGLLSQ